MSYTNEEWGFRAKECLKKGEFVGIISICFDCNYAIPVKNIYSALYKYCICEPQKISTIEELSNIHELKLTISFNKPNAKKMD